MLSKIMLRSCLSHSLGQHISNLCFKEATYENFKVPIIRPKDSHLLLRPAFYLTFLAFSSKRYLTGLSYICAYEEGRKLPS